MYSGPLPPHLHQMTTLFCRRAISQLLQRTSKCSFSIRRVAVESGGRTSSNAEAPTVSHRNKITWSDEDFYQKTNKERVVFLVESRLGPLSTDTRTLETKLASGEVDPFTFAKTYLAEGSVDIEAIRVLLTAAKAQLFKLHRSERHEAYAAKRVELGRSVLSRIWENSNLWLNLIEDHQATWCLAWFAMLDDVDHLC